MLFMSAALECCLVCYERKADICNVCATGQFHPARRISRPAGRLPISCLKKIVHLIMNVSTDPGQVRT